ncbi:MAG TPA: hypothetical protein P5572_16350 [Phycisphaerae bacterium]|nr:hypothetical protein [Phycisphaerae bacterium]
MRATNLLTRRQPPWQVLVSLAGVDAAGPWVHDVDRLVAPEQIRVSAADDERQAVARIEAGGVDLAVLCSQGATRGGLRTLEVVRARFTDLPCLVVAHETTAGILRRALELRAESVIPQPVNVPLLAQLMVRILKKRFAVQP